MNSTYTLTEGNDALNRVLLMMRYEMGKTLDEQKIPTDKDIKKFKDNEYYNNTQKFVDNLAVSFRGPDGRQKTTGTSPKVSKITPPEWHGTAEEFFEGLRGAAYSWTGIAIDIFLSHVGLPEVGIVVFGALLAYDIKLWIDGKPDYFNLFCDTLAVISGGAYLAQLKGLKMSGKIFKSFGEIFMYLSTKMKSFWKLIKPFFTGIGKFIGKLTEILTKGIKWLSSKITPEFIKELGPGLKEFFLMLKKGGSTIISFLKNLVKAIFDGIEKLTYTGAKKFGAGEKVAQAAGKSAKGTAVGYTVAKGVVEPIAKPIMQKNAEKELTKIGGDIQGDYD
tara:strand:+ start:3035 stop:4036 length:1002 start_codon:yes stop_codon:yes gene_type:complete